MITVNDEEKVKQLFFCCCSERVKTPLWGGLLICSGINELIGVFFNSSSGAVSWSLVNEVVVSFV